MAIKVVGCLPHYSQPLQRHSARKCPAGIVAQTDTIIGTISCAKLAKYFVHGRHALCLLALSFAAIISHWRTDANLDCRGIFFITSAYPDSGSTFYRKPIAGYDACDQQIEQQKHAQQHRLILATIAVHCHFIRAFASYNYVMICIHGASELCFESVNRDRALIRCHKMCLSMYASHEPQRSAGGVSATQFSPACRCSTCTQLLRVETLPTRTFRTGQQSTCSWAASAPGLDQRLLLLALSR